MNGREPNRLYRALALIGLAVAALALVLLLALLAARADATTVDRRPAPGTPVEDAAGSCGVFVTSEVLLARRVMSEQASQSLTVALTNEGADACAVAVTLAAPDFRASPPQTQLTVTAAAGATTEHAWVISPLRAGDFEVAVIVGNSVTVLGISVTTVLGLTPLQAEILSLVGSVLGPMLTLPWWYERWQERRARQEQARREQAAQQDEGGAES
jgi:hypothetical protein